MGNRNRKKNISTIIILAIVLLVPGFLYIALNQVGSNEYLKLPIYGEKSLSGKMNRKMGREIPDTTYHTLKPLVLKDADGSAVSLFNQDSLISVVHLYYAKDNGLSNSLLYNIKDVVKRFDYNSKIKFYSISIDSSDQGLVLADLEKKYNPDGFKNWKILGSSDSILNYAKDNLLIDAFKEPGDNNKFVFGNSYILIDAQNRIRGFYDINMKTELGRLEDEIKVQIVEELRNHPLKIEKK